MHIQVGHAAYRDDYRDVYAGYRSLREVCRAGLATQRLPGGRSTLGFFPPLPPLQTASPTEIPTPQMDREQLRSSQVLSSVTPCHGFVLAVLQLPSDLLTLVRLGICLPQHKAYHRLSTQCLDQMFL